MLALVSFWAFHLVVSGRRTIHGDELSPEVLRAVPKAARRVRSLARLWAHQPLPEPARA
jgi:hypothetical protein